MKVNDQFVARYIASAPLALALERSLECHILAQQEFEHPVLDIGCGDGIFSSTLLGEEVDVGVDSDPRELQRAHSRGMYNELICCAAQEIPKPNGSFKTIFANSVFEHIVDLSDVLREALRLLADDGRMYVTVPTDMFDHFTASYQLLAKLRLNSLAERFRKFFNHFWKHYHYYNSAGWRLLFEECGWTVSQQREYNSKGNCLLNNTLVPLSILSFLSRKFLNRWFVIPFFRRLYAPLLAVFFVPTIERQLAVLENGGLIFFELRKQTVH